MPSKSFEICFVLWRSSIYSDAKFEDRWPLIQNLLTNKIKHKSLINSSWNISVLKKVQRPKKSNLFRTLSKSFKICFVLWKSSIYSDANFEDRWPLIQNLLTNKIKRKSLINSSWNISVLKKVQCPKKSLHHWLFLGRCTFFRTEMFQDEFIKDLRLILFVGRFWMIGHLFSKFASL